MFTIPAFIDSVSEIRDLDYPGFSGLCRFTLERYQDEDFQRAGIVMPAQIVLAVNKRKAEYLAGRYLCRWLMHKAGLTDTHIAIGDDRAPRWPSGVTGSISHNKTTAVCAISFAEHCRGTGIDVETIMPAQTASHLASAIISDTERRYLSGVTISTENSRWPDDSSAAHFSLLLTLVFSAKESLFKALYPLLGDYFDFLDISLLAIDTRQRCFTLQLEKTLHPQFIHGQHVTGRYLFHDNSVITLIYL